MSFEKEIEKLALSVAKNAMASGTTLQDQTEALKVLTPIYNARMKGKKLSDEDETGEANFDEFAKKLNAIQESADGGSEQAVRSGRKRRLS